MADKKIVIEPVPPDGAFQPVSIDLHLSPMVKHYEWDGLAIDIKSPPALVDDTIDYVFDIIEPGGFMLGSTLEHVSVPNDLYAKVEGKSSIARCGLLVHITAGFIDPGFRGNITLELKNVNNVPVIIRSGMPICQICFGRVEGRIARPYGSNGLGSRYQDSKGTVGPRSPQ